MERIIAYTTKLTKILKEIKQLKVERFQIVEEIEEMKREKLEYVVFTFGETNRVKVDVMVERLLSEEDKHKNLVQRLKEIDLKLTELEMDAEIVKEELETQKILSKLGAEI